ncbi:MAG: hypothetical protein RLZZ623_2935 [Actinomycetota bacterium]
MRCSSISELENECEADDAVPVLVEFHRTTKAEPRVQTLRAHHRLEGVDSKASSSAATSFVDTPQHHRFADAVTLCTGIDPEVPEARGVGIMEVEMWVPETGDEREAPDDLIVEHRHDHIGLGRSRGNVAEEFVVPRVVRIPVESEVRLLDDPSHSRRIVSVCKAPDLHGGRTYADDMHDDQRIRTLTELREHYREPSQLTANKERPTIDAVSRAFIERSRFSVIGTFDADGNPDVSPRGGTSGYVRVLDEGHIAIADLGGNNRLDTLQNIIATGRAGCVFIVPGHSETVRVNGEAWVTTDPALLEIFGLPRIPKAAIVVRVHTTFVHCAKAFLRSGMWDPDVWAELADVPDGASILHCQAVTDGSADDVRGWLDESYLQDLADER